MPGSQCGIVDLVDRALSEEHPYVALALGIFLVGTSWLWLRYAEPCSRWVMRAVGARYPRMAEGRWYRVVHVYFGAVFLFVAGLGTIVASVINLAR